jgi:hypothetical protein
MRNKNAIHLYELDDEGNKHYICNKACGITENKATYVKSKVTCKNCLAIMKKTQGYNKQVMPLKVTMKRGKEPLIFVDGVKYRPKKVTTKKIDGDIHDDEVIFEIATDETEDKLAFIKEQLKTKINVKDVLDEIVRPMTTAQVDKLYKILKEKKPKVTKQKGCLGLKIDGGKHNTAYLSIFD